MNLPTFTAEASIYDTSDHYRALGAVDHSRDTLLPTQVHAAACREKTICGFSPRDGSVKCFTICV